jgi:hypothetical protein
MAGTVVAQSSKKKDKGKKKSESNTLPKSNPTSLDPTFPQKDYAPKKTSKKKSNGPSYESEKQYADRMAQLHKTQKKNERLAMNPQYTDPTYFGHKRPPKKRPPSKMKYCKVCGIRH